MQASDQPEVQVHESKDLGEGLRLELLGDGNKYWRRFVKRSYFGNERCFPDGLPTKDWGEALRGFNMLQ